VIESLDPLELAGSGHQPLPGPAGHPVFPGEAHPAARLIECFLGRKHADAEIEHR
jgi:hypothetical protein